MIQRPSIYRSLFAFMLGILIFFQAPILHPADPNVLAPNFGLYWKSNNCFLDSSTQVLFHIKPFRDFIKTHKGVYAEGSILRGTTDTPSPEKPFALDDSFIGIIEAMSEQIKEKVGRKEIPTYEFWENLVKEDSRLQSSMPVGHDSDAQEYQSHILGKFYDDVYKKELTTLLGEFFDSLVPSEPASDADQSVKDLLAKNKTALMNLKERVLIVYFSDTEKKTITSVELLKEYLLKKIKVIKKDELLGSLSVIIQDGEHVNLLSTVNAIIAMQEEGAKTTFNNIKTLVDKDGIGAKKVVDLIKGFAALKSSYHSIANKEKNTTIRNVIKKAITGKDASVEEETADTIIIDFVIKTVGGDSSGKEYKTYSLLSGCIRRDKSKEKLLGLSVERWSEIEQKVEGYDWKVLVAKIKETEAIRTEFFDIFATNVRINKKEYSKESTASTWGSPTTSDKTDPQLLLSVQMKVKGMNLSDYLDRFFDYTHEKKGSSDVPFDNKTVSLATIKKTPEILILYLKRFDDPSNKVPTLFNFPLTGLDMTKYVDKDLQGKINSVYNLVGVVEHWGSGIGGGHYVAYGKYWDDGDENTKAGWYFYNDYPHSVDPKTEEQMQAYATPNKPDATALATGDNTPYLLVYERVDDVTWKLTMLKKKLENLRGSLVTLKDKLVTLSERLKTLKGKLGMLKRSVSSS